MPQAPYLSRNSPQTTAPATCIPRRCYPAAAQSTPLNLPTLRCSEYQPDAPYRLPGALALETTLGGPVTVPCPSRRGCVASDVLLGL